uniref:F11 receptor, tandem duplicate 1 n=1 Tax=Monopterus albus TaxID=43700 RepID=UPI0009B4D3E9|nr:junctional adhesion molecule A-like [Monopterus albus]XP_020454365.1 junctional adhesion molecule A-like [Monopterus albus]
MFVTLVVSVALFIFTSTGVSGFDVTTSTPDVRVKENEGTDLKCSYSPDFGASARLEWKFHDIKGSQTYVVFDGTPTTSYAGRVTMYESNLRMSKITRQDNGLYSCEVSGNGKFGEATVKVTVLVAPSPPACKVPSTVTTGTYVLLSCNDPDGSPPPTYSWYKDGVLLPSDPSKVSGFKNATYKLNPQNGNLEFPSVAKGDSGQYYCSAVNDAGPAQSCKPMQMEVRDLNIAGIVIGVILLLLLLAVLGFVIWYLCKKGYISPRGQSKSKPNVVYQPPTLHRDLDDGEFKQKSSFVV